MAISIFAFSADIKQLLYLKYCIKESMRLFPPVCGIGRMLDQDTNIAGCVMPRGTAIFCLIYSIHRHPDFWENPDVCVSSHVAIPYKLFLSSLIFRSLILYDLLLRIPKVVIRMPLSPSLLDLGLSNLSIHNS